MIWNPLIGSQRIIINTRDIQVNRSNKILKTLICKWNKILDKKGHVQGEDQEAEDQQ